MFEYTFHAGTDGDGLRRFAEEIAHHTHVSGVRQFDQDRKIRAMLAQSVVRRTPKLAPN